MLTRHSKEAHRTSSPIISPGRILACHTQHHLHDLWLRARSTGAATSVAMVPRLGHQEVLKNPPR